MHRAGTVVVVGQDCVERVSGGACGAAVHSVTGGVGIVVVVGFVGGGRVDGEVVFVSAAGHADVGHGAAGAIAQNRPADGTVNLSQPNWQM